MGIISGPGSFAVQFGDHLRSGIICGLGSFAVLGSLADPYIIIYIFSYARLPTELAENRKPCFVRKRVLGFV